MTPATFREFAMQEQAELELLSKHSARLTAAAAGQVLQARQVAGLDQELAQRHLARAKRYWMESRETDESQVARAASKIEALRADGLEQSVEGGVFQGSQYHTSMSETHYGTRGLRGGR